MRDGAVSRPTFEDILEEKDFFFFDWPSTNTPQIGEGRWRQFVEKLH